MLPTNLSAISISIAYPFPCSDRYSKRPSHSKAPRPILPSSSLISAISSSNSVSWCPYAILKSSTAGEKTAKKLSNLYLHDQLFAVCAKIRWIKRGIWSIFPALNVGARRPPSLLLGIIDRLGKTNPAFP